MTLWISKCPYTILGRASSLPVPWRHSGLSQALCTCQGTWGREGVMQDALGYFFSLWLHWFRVIICSYWERRRYGHEDCPYILSFAVCGCIFHTQEEAVRVVIAECVVIHCQQVILSSLQSPRKKTDIHANETPLTLYNQGWLSVYQVSSVQHEKIRLVSPFADSALRRFISAQVCFTWKSNILSLYHFILLPWAVIVHSHVPLGCEWGREGGSYTQRPYYPWVDLAYKLLSTIV